MREPFSPETLQAGAVKGLQLQGPVCHGESAVGGGLFVEATGAWGTGRDFVRVMGQWWTWFCQGNGTVVGVVLSG